MTWQRSVQQEGFAIIPPLFSAAEMQDLLDELYESSLHRSRAGIRHAMAHPSVAEFANDKRLLSLAREVLGKDAFPFHATLFDKSADANWLVMWHQDTALPIQQRREVPGWGPWSVKEGVTYAHVPATVLASVIALRIHLDDSHELNGPLRVLPRTHNFGVLDDQRIPELSEEISAVECLVTKGGVLGMKPLLVHASSKSQSSAPRRVLHIQYASSRFLDDGFELA